MIIRVRQRVRLGDYWPVPVLFTPPPATFTQIYITQVFPPVQMGTELLISWTSDAPPGLWYQVYLDDALVWFGTSLQATIPLPADMARIDIGMVSSANRAIDYSGPLAAAPIGR